MFKELFSNQTILPALTAWLLAQLLKVPIEYLLTRRINWALLLSAGGMPSSHSALVSSVSLAIGLYSGFDTPLFALSLVIAMIVTYDASGVRRQAGLHAEKINMLINELLQGHPISDKQLKEVLGHTQLEVAGGVLLGIATTLVFWFFLT